MVADCGDDVHECGYTKTKDGSHNYGLWAYHMTCQDYQTLINRNWRRSGKYLYKPDPSKGAVILYTIRLDASKFTPDKKHEKVVKKLVNYLDGEVPPKTEEKPKEKKVNLDENQIELLKIMDYILPNVLEELKIEEKLKKEVIDKSKEILFIMECKDQKSTYYSNIGFRLSAYLKSKNVKISPHDINHSFTSKLKEDFSIKNDMILFPRKPITKKEEIKVQEMKEKKITHKLEIKMLPSSFDQESYKLYKKYQMSVHKDKEEKLSEKGYTGFLIDSPLYYEKTGKEGNFQIKEDIPGLEGLSKVTLCSFQGYGSYHVQYRMDGKLFMVAVIDMLPECLSSVYLFYDPDFDFISPGVYSSLSEILYVKQLSKYLPSLKYYYLGYYIHNVQKMKYKAQYQPSDLLCPTKYVFVSMKDVLELVEKDTKEGVKPNERKLQLYDGKVSPISTNTDQVLCMLQQQLYRFSSLKEFLGNEMKKTVLKYQQLVGEDLSKSMIFIINLG